jgi:hypothetical protein
VVAKVNSTGTFFLLLTVSGVSFRVAQFRKDNNKDSEDNVSKVHQKRGLIRDPEKIHSGSGSRIQGVKKNWLPDPDPQLSNFSLKYILPPRMLVQVQTDLCS